jgi:Copper type II ascorbate-dependent monooxygenase, C-terminal domain
MNIRSTCAIAIAAALGVTAACGGGASSDDDVAVDAAPTIDAPDGWQPLMAGSWSLAAGEEGYFCVYATVPRDMYVKAFRPIIPLGTHHTVLTRYSGTTPDGTVRCSVGTNGQSMVYGSGVGSPDFVFPSGVGLHFTAGTRLLLNLHLYNASDATLTGTSGTLIQEATAAEIQNVSEIVLAGPTAGLVVPTGTSTQTGTCNISNVTSQPIQVFAMSQHMHKLGRHLKTVVRRGGTDIMLQDVPYNFEQQSFQLVQPTIELRPGDVLTTYCSYDNQTGAAVSFGDSSNDEMCFSDLFYYPAQGANFVCTGF